MKLKNKQTYHVVTAKGGVLSLECGTLEVAREIATKYAKDNAGQAANIYSVVESICCEVSEPKTTAPVYDDYIYVSAN